MTKLRRQGGGPTCRLSFADLTHLVSAQEVRSKNEPPTYGARRRANGYKSPRQRHIGLFTAIPLARSSRHGKDACVPGRITLRAATRLAFVAASMSSSPSDR